MSAVLTARPHRTPLEISHGPRNSNAVALTFDDGPSVHTAAILTTLRRHGARATFFVVGAQIAGREALLAEVAAAGHEVGNHTMEHPNLCGHDVDVRDQLVRLNGAISSITGNAPVVFRAPYGELDARGAAAVRAAGMKAVRWDVDPIDWQRPGSDVIEARVAAKVRPGSIVLLHEGGKRDQGVAALPGILRLLADRGLRTVTVSELLT